MLGTILAEYGLTVVGIASAALAATFPTSNAGGVTYGPLSLGPWA